MFRAFKQFGIMGALFAAGLPAFGFSLLGPFNETYQVAAIGYNLAPPNIPLTDNGAPKNIAQEYRYNTKYIYYAYDTTFLDFYGTEGAAAVDKAFAILNNLLDVDSYTPTLSEWPMNTTRVNQEAAALGLIDIKSVALSSILEELGLAQPERWVWCLRDRTLPTGGACPDYLYTIIQRNYDPISGIYSPYVNGNLFDFQIHEYCASAVAPPGGLLAVAVPVQVAGPNPSYGAVADQQAFSTIGEYYTDLTRDDVAGLRYLLSSNTINNESLDPNTLVVDTNVVPTLLITSNLATLAAAELTNNPAQLLALFPGLQITSSSFTLTNLVTATTTAFYSNSPLSQVGSPPLLYTVTTYTTNYGFAIWTYTFGNVVTNVFSTNGQIYIEQTTVTSSPYGQYGAPPSTNTSVTILTSNFVTGEYFILPTNQCGFTIIATNQLPVQFVTNLVATNAGTISNAAGQSYSVVEPYTNYELEVQIYTCTPPGVALRQGVGKIQFYRQDFDSLTGTTWAPVSNSFNITLVTNGKPVVQTIFRNVTAPDIRFSAADLAPGPTNSAYTRTVPAYNQANVLPNLAGPGTINPEGVQIVFNNVGPFATATNGPSVSGASSFYWGSFDGTTNAPTVFPSSLSLATLASNVFLQITSVGPLPNGIVNQFYNVQLQATGIQGPPYAWSVPATVGGVPNSLPPGMLPIGASSGLISGTPTNTGIFDFQVEVSDSFGRTSFRNFSIEIDP